MGVIQRAEPPINFREQDERKAAYDQVGFLNDKKKTSSWYKDIYEFYQNNEC